MIFTEFRFLFFFAAVFAVHWLLPRQRWRKIWLLVASYTFYAAWDWRFLSLILISTGVDYAVGLGLERATDRGRRRRLLLVSLVVNLGLLGVFKYFDFFLESLGGLLDVLGVPWHPATLGIILPVGISFYTFQTLSYSIDIYRGDLRATRDLLDLALFVAFFPQLVAGPIVRAREFLPQLKEKRALFSVNGKAALVLFLIGFIKKACISDNLAPHIDRFFEAPELFDATSAWIAVLFYAVQIYCDFSGYSDMAIACAALLGYTLPLNFNFPYFAADIREFWRRWHISLSTWLRDYLYISLGGNRGGDRRTRFNLMTTMLLGGLWHGAAWNFVIWGALHGGALVGHRAIDKGRDSSPPWWRRALGVMATFYWVCVAWIFFRAVGLDQALSIARSFILFHSSGQYVLLNPLSAFSVFAGLAIVHWLASRRVLLGRFERLPDPAFAAAYGVMSAVALAFYPRGAEPFIYFQF